MSYVVVREKDQIVEEILFRSHDFDDADAALQYYESLYMSEYGEEEAACIRLYIDKGDVV